MKSVNLVTCSSEEFRRVISDAMKLGEHDEIVKFFVPKAPKFLKLQLAERLLITNYRNGHIDAILAAYRAGRWHVKWSTPEVSK